MTTVFVDTWAWYALTDKVDSDHSMAQRINKELHKKGYRFVTTNFVLAEAINLIRQKLYHQAAVRFWYTIKQMEDAGLMQIVRLDEKDEDQAWAIFEKYADQKFSFTDCTSFAVMRSLGLTEVFTADHHFAVLGFLLVP